MTQSRAALFWQENAHNFVTYIFGGGRGGYLSRFLRNFEFFSRILPIFLLPSPLSPSPLPFFSVPPPGILLSVFPGFPAQKKGGRDVCGDIHSRPGAFGRFL